VSYAYLRAFVRSLWITVNEHRSRCFRRVMSQRTSQLIRTSSMSIDRAFRTPRIISQPLTSNVHEATGSRQAEHQLHDASFVEQRVTGSCGDRCGWPTTFILEDRAPAHLASGTLVRVEHLVPAAPRLLSLYVPDSPAAPAALSTVIEMRRLRPSTKISSCGREPRSESVVAHPSD
jgi:hypothetical protein